MMLKDRRKWVCQFIYLSWCAISFFFCFDEVCSIHNVCFACCLDFDGWWWSKWSWMRWVEWVSQSVPWEVNRVNQSIQHGNQSINQESERSCSGKVCLPARRSSSICRRDRWSHTLQAPNRADWQVPGKNLITHFGTIWLVQTESGPNSDLATVSIEYWNQSRVVCLLMVVEFYITVLRTRRHRIWFDVSFCRTERFVCFKSCTATLHAVNARLLVVLLSSEKRTKQWESGIRNLKISETNEKRQRKRHKSPITTKTPKTKSIQTNHLSLDITSHIILIQRYNSIH